MTLTSQEDRVAGRTHRVSQVKPGGPAHRAGVRVGDVITKINGATINGLQHWEVLKLLGKGRMHKTQFACAKTLSLNVIVECFLHPKNLLDERGGSLLVL